MIFSETEYGSDVTGTVNRWMPLLGCDQTIEALGGRRLRLDET